MSGGSKISKPIFRLGQALWKNNIGLNLESVAPKPTLGKYSVNTHRRDGKKKRRSQ